MAQAQLHMANIMVDVDHEMSIDDIEGNEEVFADQGTGDSNQDQLTEIFSLDEKWFYWIDFKWLCNIPFTRGLDIEPLF